MVEFEEADVSGMNGPGRPTIDRTKELHDALVEANARAEETHRYGFSVALADDERGDKFYRFTQRCRSAAKRAGIKVSVSDPKDGAHGNVRILADGDM